MRILSHVVPVILIGLSLSIAGSACFAARTSADSTEARTNYATLKVNPYGFMVPYSGIHLTVKTIDGQERGPDGKKYSSASELQLTPGSHQFEVIFRAKDRSMGFVGELWDRILPIHPPHTSPQTISAELEAGHTYYINPRGRPENSDTLLPPIVDEFHIWVINSEEGKILTLNNIPKGCVLLVRSLSAQVIIEKALEGNEWSWNGTKSNGGKVHSGLYFLSAFNSEGNGFTGHVIVE